MTSTRCMSPPQGASSTFGPSTPYSQVLDGALALLQGGFDDWGILLEKVMRSDRSPLGVCQAKELFRGVVGSEGIAQDVPVVRDDIGIARLFHSVDESPGWSQGY